MSAVDTLWKSNRATRTERRSGFRASPSRSWSRHPFRLGVAGLFVMMVAVPTSATVASAAPSVSTASTVTHYAIGKPVCKKAKPGHSTCFAVRRIEVTKGTRGAHAYRLAAGAIASAATTGPSATIGPAGGLTPSDLATAYSFNATATGTGQTVAIVDAYNDPNINADLQTFDAHYGLVACSLANACLRVVNQTGGTTPPANDTSGWSEEESLDVEAVHSVCQNCKIILVEAASSSNVNLEKAEAEAVALKATEITNSFGGPEAGSTATDEAAYNHPGVVITASTGDDGYYSFDQHAATNQPNAPASYNTVVAVGGTSLYLGQTAARQTETVWNDNGTKGYYQSLVGAPLGAGGGGCSTLIPAKGWQSSLPVWGSTACGTHRLAADVAADADYLTGLDVYDSYNCGSACSPPVPGWFTIGGTSLASPIVAAVYGLAGGAHGVPYPAVSLYGHLGKSSLYDVTSGGNGYCDGEGAAACGDPNLFGVGILDCDFPATGTIPSIGDRACDALPGFDGPTGVGTPIGLGAFAKVGPTGTVGGPTAVTHGVVGAWTATATDPLPGGVIASYSWNWGDGTAATVTTTGAASHVYATGGVTDTITLTIKDNYGVTGTATYSVVVT